MDGAKKEGGTERGRIGQRRRDKLHLNKQLDPLRGASQGQHHKETYITFYYDP